MSSRYILSAPVQGPARSCWPALPTRRPSATCATSSSSAPTTSDASFDSYMWTLVYQSHPKIGPGFLIWLRPTPLMAEPSFEFAATTSSHRPRCRAQPVLRMPLRYVLPPVHTTNCNRARPATAKTSLQARPRARRRMERKNKNELGMFAQ